MMESVIGEKNFPLVETIDFRRIQRSKTEDERLRIVCSFII